MKQRETLETGYQMYQLPLFFFFLPRQVTGEVKFSELYEALCYIGILPVLLYLHE